MRIHQHSSGVWSVAYGPDGTLFALTVRYGELWAYPPNGNRVLAARETSEHRLEGSLDVSPDGRWLSVSGLRKPTLFRVGSFSPEPGVAPPTNRCSLLPGWEEFRFPEFIFSDRPCFTRNSAFWVGHTHDGTASYKDRLRCWRLPDLTPFEYVGFPVTRNQHMAAGAGPEQVVIEGWSVKHDACAFWLGDLARPDDPVTEPVGTVKHCNGFVVGSDGRFYVSYHGQVLIYSAGAGGFRLDLTVPLPHCTSTPELSLSADARRFVARSFRSKLVCAVDSATGEVFGPWDWGIGQVNDAAIAPDGLTACAAGSSKKLVVWDIDG